MSIDRATHADMPVPLRLVERVACVLPALVLAYPMLVWPLVYAEPVAELSGLEQPKVDVGDYLLNKIYFPPLLLLGLTSLLALRRPIPCRMRPLIWALAALLGFWAISALWSLAPEITIRRLALEAVICGIVICAVLSASRTYDLLTPVVWLMIGTQAINLLAVIAWPAGPLGHEGIYNHKNSLGNAAGLAIIVGLYGLARGSTARRTAALASIVIALFLLHQSNSKTAMALAFVAPAVGLYLYFTCRICRIPLVLALSGTSIAVVVALLAVATTIDLELGDVFLWLFNDKTFTGRTHIWEFAIGHIQERPWLGYGYSGFWDIGPDSPKFASPDFIAKMPHAHNGYLNSMLETGVIGFGLLVAFLVTALHCIGRVATGDAVAFLFFSTLASYVLLTNLMESDLLTPMSASSTLFVLTSAVACGRLGPGNDV